MRGSLDRSLLSYFQYEWRMSSTMDERRWRHDYDDEYEMEGVNFTIVTRTVFI